LRLTSENSFFILNASPRIWGGEEHLGFFWSEVRGELCWCSKHIQCSSGGLNDASTRQ